MAERLEDAGQVTANCQELLPVESLKFRRLPVMVRRQIGIRAKGTGGTFFRDYLASTTAYVFFPELFEFRGSLLRPGGRLMIKLCRPDSNPSQFHG
mgnify:CR=1 FL=1